MLANGRLTSISATTTYKNYREVLQDFNVILTVNGSERDKYDINYEWTFYNSNCKTFTRSLEVKRCDVIAF